jgi:hypothetical protein
MQRGKITQDENLLLKIYCEVIGYYYLDDFIIVYGHTGLLLQQPAVSLVL